MLRNEVWGSHQLIFTCFSLVCQHTRISNMQHKIYTQCKDLKQVEQWYHFLTVVSFKIFIALNCLKVGQCTTCVSEVKFHYYSTLKGTVYIKLGTRGEEGFFLLIVDESLKWKFTAIYVVYAIKQHTMHRYYL